jgi:hypothetical protein
VGKVSVKLSTSLYRDQPQQDCEYDTLTFIHTLTNVKRTEIFPVPLPLIVKNI